MLRFFKPNSFICFKNKKPFTKYFSQSKKISTHVDEKDNAFFNQVNDWWDTQGSMFTLHYYNDLRIKYLKQQLKYDFNSALPFEKMKFLDIGCGAGLLCEAVGRLGAQVTGIDSNSNSYNIAKGHLNVYEGDEKAVMKKRVNYFLGSIDNFKMENNEKFDVVTAMEVIEHVNSPKSFIKDISYFVKNEGYLFMSTINKTNKSYLNAILLGERLTGIIPNGTHEWEKFIDPAKLINILEQNNFTIKNISGVSYNPFTSHMKLVEDKSVNYILVAQKKVNNCE